MKTFLSVLFIAFVALSIEINFDSFNSDEDKDKDFIARLAFWLPEEKSEDQMQQEQDEYLKNAETLDLSAIEKAAKEIEAQKQKTEELVAIDERFKEIIDEPSKSQSEAKELSQPLFGDASTKNEPLSSSQANKTQESSIASTQSTSSSAASTIETSSNISTAVSQTPEVQAQVEKASVNIEEVDSENIAFEGFAVTKSPSFLITNFTLRNRIDTRHRGVFSFALVLENGEKKYIDFSPATYNFLRLVAKNYEIPIPSELKADAVNAVGFLVEVKNQSNKLLLSRFYTF